MGLIKAPVTALAICDDVLLAGVGSFVKLYDLDTRRLCFVKRLFQTSAIHGIKIFKHDNETLAIVFGNKDLQIFQIINNKWPSDEYLNCKFKWVTSDWIWDAILLYSNNDNSATCSTIATALGHNSISLIDWNLGIELQEIHCEEKCILYSAYFLCEQRPTWRSLTLCSGTVFNQVVIWKPSILNEAMRARVIERIHAHDGVIFSMDFDLRRRLLVTASDDRSIRVWNCETLVNHLQIIEAPALLSTSKSLCKLYGHDSRVWKAQILQLDDEDYVVSVGEDGCCIIWKITKSCMDNGKEEYSGLLVKRVKSHKGRNIWSMVIDGEYLCTGGGDGAIRIWKFSDLLKDKVTITKHPFPNSLNNIGVIKSVHSCNGNIILARTDEGVLLRYEIATSCWNVLYCTENLKSYVALSICPEALAVAIGSTKGVLTVLMFDNSWKSIEHEISFEYPHARGKIHNLTWEYNNATSFLFVSGLHGNFTVYRVTGSSIPICEVQTFKLPMAKHRWHMGAASVEHNDIIYVVVGDRRGSLHLLKVGMESPMYTIHGVHGKNGITSVSRVGKYFYSTGRDGIWRKLSINYTDESIRILQQNRAAQGMGWLESLIPLNSNQMGILGFHGRNFIIWSCKTGDTLISVECGGGHRDWTLMSGNYRASLAFVKESVMHIATANRNVLVEKSVLESHFHAGQITCVKHIGSWKNKNASSPNTLLVTGGEDTKVYISLYSKDAAGIDNIKKQSLIDDHISSVRAVTCLTKEDTETFSKIFLFTGGGRASMHCYLVTIDKALEDATQSCDVEHLCSYSSTRGTSKCATESRSNVDPEMRFMDFSAWNEGKRITVAAACSDGIVRILQLDPELKSICEITHSHMLSHCLLVIGTTSISTKRWIVTGGTDGFLRIWTLDVSNHSIFLLQVFFLEHHMSGVNALDIMRIPHSIKKIPSNSIMIATGGDDNSIHMSLIAWENDSFQIIDQNKAVKAHSTQITGLKLIRSDNSKSLQLLSTSIDQRVTKWTVNVTDNVLTLTFTRSFFSSIADVSALEVWFDGNSSCYAVCGQGIQIMHEM